MIKERYSNTDVRDLLEDFRKRNFSPSYALLADKIGITYTYLVAFKNGTLDMGQEGLSRIVEFIEENS